MEEQEDRISLLPDCLVGHILYLLPPKAAARTMVLSRRWSNVWPSLPLDLNLDSPNSDVDFLSAESITSILSSHRGPIRCFCVTTDAGFGTRAWLRNLAQKRLDDTLILRWASDLEQPTLPANLLGSAGVNLRHLVLHCCRLGGPGNTRSPVPILPRLDFLYLSNVLISEAALHSMIQVCPVIRELHLFMIDGLRLISFHSHTLKILYVSVPRVPLDEFSDQHMPNLERVTFEFVNLWRIPAFTIDSGKKVRELALKLPTMDSPHLSIISNQRRLFFITSLVFGMKFADGEELRRGVHILSLFPRLQRLEIRCFNFGTPNAQDFGDWDSLLETTILPMKHLRHIIFNGYCGTIGENEFARYLMCKAESLTSMEINHAVDWSLQDINYQKESICSRDKACHLCFMRSKDSDTMRRNIAQFMHGVAFN
ncbi:putative F-box/LRR-repeat protein At3g49150 [Miscanthus floridulus]|uniref:putative F-box/LRR-repeat protein At3g49150 n=1 Tax=Miscanthus floridulus TaxID=154761 RepID=UPI003458B392